MGTGQQALVSASAGGTPPAPPATGLQFWLKADAIEGLITGDDISTWNDSSGNGRNVTGVVVATKKPTYRATDGPNSLPAVRLLNNADSLGGYFTVPNFLTGYTAGHGLVVMKLDIEPALNNHASPAMADWGSVGDEYFTFPSDGVIYDAFGSNARKTTVNPVPALTSWFLYECRSASGAWSNRIDGTQLFTTAVNTVGFSAAAKIGHSATGTKYMYGMVAEVLFYNAVLGATEYTELKAYITDKYGLTLA